MNERLDTTSLIPVDPDSQVGLVFRRLSAIRCELGEPALDRAVRATLVTLGRAAHEEAELRARIQRERERPVRDTVHVVPFAHRRVPEGFDEGEP